MVYSSNQSLYTALGVILSFVSYASSATRNYQLEVVNEIIHPDGFSRSTTLANGVFPGPLISANAGDVLAVNVTDKTTDSSMKRSTSIHWHGIFQQRTAMDDGVAFVTQCPIAPGDSFLYNFPLDGQTGTYWYHSHYQLQLCDGLKGPLVIYDPKDPLLRLYDVDDAQTVITLSDWYHQTASEAFNQFSVPNASLINGLGRYPDGPQSPLAVVNVKKGLRYRFRIVQISCGSAYTFSIDGHRMTIIETDGVEIEPYEVDSVAIFAAQRYSVVVEANQNVGNYRIRNDPGTLQPGNGPAGFVGGINSAIVRYEGAPAVDPTTEQNPNGVLALEQNMHPLILPAIFAPHRQWLPDSDGKPVIYINLNITVDFTHMTLPVFDVNGASFQPPTIPILLQILSGAVKPGQIQPSGSVYILPKNVLVEVTIPGTDPAITAAPHPFHLHGNKFSVVRSANSTKYNYINPVQRDVVNTGVLGDNVTFRFRTDNPGPWFLHCHIDFHLEAGLAVVFAVDPESQVSGPQSEETNQAFESLCPKYDALPASLQ